MCELELVFPSKNNELDAIEYRKEHFLIGENILHGDSGLDEAQKYDEWLEKIIDAKERAVHSYIFFAFRKSDNKLVGTINVRYPYEGYVKIHGHIGYGVRPSERKKGYATKMLKLSLEYCKTIGLDRVLLTCDKSNIASAKTIKNCNGVFETEVLQVDGGILQRYWIEV